MEAKREDVIFKCAEGLFKISKEIQPINSELSNTILYLSDRILKEIETPSESDILKISALVEDPKLVIFTKEQMHAKHLETCPDCGGYKESTLHNVETCPDCGGIKDSTLAKFSDSFVTEEVKVSVMCNGHSGDGSGGTPIIDGSNYSNQTQSVEPQPRSTKVQEEVKSLIEELRKGLK